MSDSITSIKLSELSLDELVALVQGWGREIDTRRVWRAHVQKHIAARLAAGERTGVIQAGDATAPGALLEAAAKG